MGLAPEMVRVGDDQVVLCVGDSLVVMASRDGVQGWEGGPIEEVSVQHLPAGLSDDNIKCVCGLLTEKGGKRGGGGW